MSVYFVLDVDHDQYAEAALTAYANACFREYPVLAEDITNVLNGANPFVEAGCLDTSWEDRKGPRKQ